MFVHVSEQVAEPLVDVTHDEVHRTEEHRQVPSKRSSKYEQTVGIGQTLGTPTEDTWPGVTKLPDYKSSFPNWSENILRSLLKNMDDDGIDLLEKMLVYDPVRRISAKDCLDHPYLND
ncbi:cyclin-dependent kinase 1 [Ixodes scapularis]